MPSPFPGIDPYIEGQLWEDFHHAYIETVREVLTTLVRPRYKVRVEVRVYLEHTPEEDTRIMLPDVAILEPTNDPWGPAMGGTGTLVMIEPVVMTVPQPEEQREGYLIITKRDEQDIITAIELLSPTNKRPRSDGLREYLRKRDSVLRSDAHLVELDLLRGGDRLPTVETPPPADFYAFVHRRPMRPQAQVYPWTLRHRLPTIPIPLADGDPDVPLDLQAVFNTVYDRAGYDYNLDYRRPIEPPLAEADATWVQDIWADQKST